MPDRTPAPALQPVGESDRVSSVDTLRGVAVLGILAMNIIAFGLPLGAYMNPVNPAVNRYAGEFSGLNAAVYHVCAYVFSQKMMTIFSMLFGAGLVLMDSRARAAATGAGAPRPPLARVYYRRLLWLLVIGMVHAYLIWFGDILVAYALCGLVLYPLRHWRPRALIALGGVLVAICLLLSVAMGSGIEHMKGQADAAQAAADAGATLTEAQQEAIDRWDEMSADFNPAPEEVDREIARFRGGPAEVLAINAKTAVTFQTFFFLINTMWWGTGVMLLGMALLRLGVLSATRPRGFYAALLGVGYAAGAPLTFLGQRHDFAHGFDLGAMFRAGLPLHSLGALAVALGHVGLVMLVCKSGALPRLRGRLAAVGRMALTNYLAQSLLCTAVFYGWGLGRYARWERAEVYAVVLGVWALQLAWSPWWLARFRFGPAEWLWRWLTYGRRPPMRRGPRAGAAPAAPT